MAWKKNTPEATRRFDELVAVPGAQREFKFGCPVYLLGEHQYAMLHENRVVLRLPTEHAAQLIAKGGRMFEPMKGRPMKDRVVVLEALAGNARSLRGWVQKTVQHARSA
jgi:hypothetical protein